jgi:hypothetical protein
MIQPPSIQVDQLTKRKKQERNDLCRVIAAKIGSHLSFDRCRKFAHVCDLTFPYVVNLLEQQPNCAICGDPMVTCAGKKCGWQWSIDRIDNQKGHIMGNVRLTCYYCNIRQYSIPPTFEEASLMKRTKTCKAGCHIATVSRFDTRLMHIAIKLRRIVSPPVTQIVINNPIAAVASVCAKKAIGHVTTKKKQKFSQKKLIDTGNRTKPTCDLCGTSFSTNQILMRHKARKVPCLRLNIHPNEIANPLRCIHCNLILSTKGKLTRHHKICKVKNNKVQPTIMSQEQKIQTLIEQASLDHKKHVEELEGLRKKHAEEYEKIQNAQDIVIESLRKQVEQLLTNRSAWNEVLQDAGKMYPYSATRESLERV